MELELIIKVAEFENKKSELKNLFLNFEINIYSKAVLEKINMIYIPDDLKAQGINHNTVSPL